MQIGDLPLLLTCQLDRLGAKTGYLREIEGEL